MISNENIKEIISHFKEKDIEVRVRDISYIALKHLFFDPNTAYKSIFGQSDDSEIEVYSNSTMIEELEKYMSENFFETGAADISFEENKAYMLKLRTGIEREIDEGRISKKDGYKMLTDISTKLNDKFNVSEDTKDSVVIVNHKYNDICPVCRHEIERRPISKEEAMDMYNLVEKTK